MSLFALGCPFGVLTVVVRPCSGFPLLSRVIVSMSMGGDVSSSLENFATTPALHELPFRSLRSNRLSPCRRICLRWQLVFGVVALDRLDVARSHPPIRDMSCGNPKLLIPTYVETP